MTKVIAIAAGGTGGHMMPALELAGALTPQHKILWFGSQKPAEQKRIAALGYGFVALSVQSFSLKPSWQLLFGLARLAWSLGQALSQLLRHRPSAIIVFGSYVSLPVGLAARCLGIPLAVHEQNTVLGKANRWLMPRAALRWSAYDHVYPKAYHSHRVGNPVRSSIAAVPACTAAPDRPLRVLVLGGSQGADELNRLLPPVFLACLEAGVALDICHQTGHKTLQATQQHYAAWPETFTQAVRCDAFIEAMDEAYTWADVVIARSGAMTCAELAAAGRGGVLVPLAHAADDHQRHNAQVMEQAGACVLMDAKAICQGKLFEQLQHWSEAPEACVALGAAAKALAEHEALALMLKDLVSLIF